MSKRSNRTSVIELGGEPRINFLPGEIQARKDARRRRRSLFMLVILVGILCGIGYFYSAQYATDRQAALEAEQQTTLELLAQQGQFSEARTLANQVNVVGKAITHVSRNETPWRELISELRGALPAGVQLQQWAITGPNSQQVAELSDDLITVEVGALVSIDVVATSLATLGDALDRISALPGVLSVATPSTALLEDGRGYGAVIGVVFSSDVYKGRFVDGWVPGMTPIPVPTTPSIEEFSGGDEELAEGDEAEEVDP